MVGAPIDPELTADAEEGGDVGPLGAGAGTSLHRQSPPRAPAPGSAGSAQARPGCTRAAAGVGRRVRGARALCGSTFGFMFQYSDNCGCICDVSPLASSARGKYIKYNIAYRPEDQEENTSGHYR